MEPSAGNAGAHSNHDRVIFIPPYDPQTRRSRQQQQWPNLAVEAHKPFFKNLEKQPGSSPSRQPRPPALLLRRRSSISWPKSRFAEPPTPRRSSAASPAYPVAASAFASQTQTPRYVAVSTPHNPGDPDDDEELFLLAGAPASPSAARCRRHRVRVGLELAALVLFLAVLVVSLAARPLKGRVVWGLEIWKWCVTVIAVFSGHLVSRWLVTLLVFLLERNFLLRRTKVLYFVFGLKRSFHVVLWLAFVLIAWSQLFDRKDVGRPPKTARILNYISRFVATLLIGSVIWLTKTCLMKLIASTFHRKTFFDRIQESVFHQYVLQMLSGPPVMERETSGLVSLSRTKEEKRVPDQVIDVVKLRGMSHEKVSAWTMKGLITVIRSSRLSTISNTIERFNDGYEIEQKDTEISSEWEAKAAAFAIFKNVARPGYKYIEEVDLLRFFNEEEVELVLSMFEGASETGKIKKSAMRNWVVKAYLERKSLVHSLNDTKTAVMQLHNFTRIIVIIIIIIITLLLMGIATPKILVVISSQLLVVVFIFGNACKTVFEALIFVFIMHPFDVGDRCVIDGTQMVVEEMNILTTIFLKNDNEKIYYPNAVLSTKPISNFYRSPNMFETIDFAIAVSTSVESIGALKSRIKG
ncbi:hypothetical protein EJB05_55266, partial [Eragrostis curvula]